MVSMHSSIKLGSPVVYCYYEHMATLVSQGSVEDVGLRELKKQRTRHLIADTAVRLFAERGFEAVSVVEVAKAAEVSEATVFNYFPTKEDLVYERMEAYETAMMEAVRSRPTGRSILDAVRDYVLEPRGFLAAGDTGEARPLMTLSRIISGSPSLLAREREVFSRYTESLAVLIATESGGSTDDIGPWIVANALIGVHHALVELVRRHLNEGETDSRRLSEEVRAQGTASFAILERGLARWPDSGARPDR
jgi:AcrR family transcriptional regulator